MRARFAWGAPLSDENPDILPLTPDAVGQLRLPWLSRFNSDTLLNHLEANPGKALWVPKTGEYIIAEQWRRRDDIGNIVEVTARKGKTALVSAMTTLLRDDRYQLVLLAEDVWHDQTRVYTNLGFALIEKIVFFQKELKGDPTVGLRSSLPPLDYRIADQDDLDLLIHLDNNSFPWLWWNSREEMAVYLAMDHVYIYLACAHGEPIGYASFTMYNGWAHLDRLAVIKAQQRRKYGAAQLSQAMRSMLTLGAGRVALSTQENNLQSHHLYKGFGFKQTRETMGIYGLGTEDQPIAD